MNLLEKKNIKIVNPKVYLLGHNMTLNQQSPETIVALGGKLCYSKVGISELQDKLSEEDISKFVSMLAKMGHESPIEHANFTFGIEGISRACSHQIVRHRLNSYSQQSQRYVNLDGIMEITCPPAIKDSKEALEIYINSVSNDYDNYVNLSNRLTNIYISDGMTPSNAEKKAIEDARFLLPNAVATKMVMTSNARSLLNFFEKRCCNRAQWEIRDVANQMLDLSLSVAPHLFAKAGAPCTFGNCPEGKMTCGNPKELRPLQKKLVK